MANEIEIQIGARRRKVVVPESWNDLDTKSLCLYYEMLFSTPGDEYTATAFTTVKLLSMMQHLLKVDADFLVLWEADRIRKNPEAGELGFLDELRQTLHYSIAGLFDIQEKDGATTYAAKLNLTRNPWPVLSGQGRTKKQAKRMYYAPADALDNLTIYEMGMAFNLFENYLISGDEGYALSLLALLYRPTRPETVKERESAWGGDRRQPIRGYEGKIDERVALVKTLPNTVKRVLLFWFAGCRQQIVDAYPKVFHKNSNGGKNEYGWGGVLLSVAESGPMGALGEVSDQHYSNVLTYISMKADEAEETRKRMEENRRKSR